MLDGGPSRVPQPFDRRAMQRPVRRQSDEVQPDEPVSPNQSEPQDSGNRQSRKPRSKKPSMRTLVVVGLVIALAIAGWFAWSSMNTTSLGVDKTKHQAVFLANGEIVFGKLEKLNDDYLKLSDVFYIKTNEDESSESEDANQPAANQSNMQLIKRGEEVHGPEDSMVINRDQVLFFENLKTDSQVTKLINNYKSQNN